MLGRSMCRGAGGRLQPTASNMSQRTEFYQQPHQLGSESIPSEASDEPAAPADTFMAAL